jgi:hypothetical protein
MLFKAKKFCEHFGIHFLVPANELTEARRNEMKEQAESIKMY